MTRSILAFFLLLTLIISSCGSDETQSGASAPEYNQDPYNGVMTTFYEDGKSVKQTFEMKDSLRHGKATQYYDTGEVNTVMTFENGLKQGDAIYYRRNKSIYRSTPYVDDQKHGMQIGYYDNGDVMFEMPYSHGTPIAGLKEYNEDGSLVAEPKLHFEKNSKGGYTVSVKPKRTKVDFYNTTVYNQGGERIYETTSKISAKRGVCTISRARTVAAKIYTSNRAAYLIYDAP